MKPNGQTPSAADVARNRHRNCEPLYLEGDDPNTKEVSMRHTSLSLLLVFLLFLPPASCSSTTQNQTEAKPFNIVETTIEEIHAAYKSGQLTARQLVQMYLDRIEAYDQK